MHKSIETALILTLSMISLQCARNVVPTGVSSAIESLAIGGQFTLHDSPKVGDYAIYKQIIKMKMPGQDNQGDVLTVNININRYVIVSIDENETRIRIEVTPGSMEAYSKGRLMYKRKGGYNSVGGITEINLDKNGKMLSAYYKNESMGLNTPYKIANKGEQGYVELMPVNQEIEIKTEAGQFLCKTFTCDLSANQTINFTYGNMIASTYSKNIVYINPRVNFTKVATLTVLTSNQNFTVELSKIIKDVTYALSLTKFVLNPGFIIYDAKNIIDYVKGNILPGKEDLLNKVIPDITGSIEGMEGNSVEYLIEQGNKK